MNQNSFLADIETRRGAITLALSVLSLIAFSGAATWYPSCDGGTTCASCTGGQVCQGGTCCDIAADASICAALSCPASTSKCESVCAICGGVPTCANIRYYKECSTGACISRYRTCTGAAKCTSQISSCSLDEDCTHKACNFVQNLCELKLDFSSGFPDECTTSSECVSTDGVCGQAEKTYYATEIFPAGDYCLSGTQIPIYPLSPPVGGVSAWDCIGSEGGAIANCNATRVEGPVEGSCGAQADFCAAGDFWDLLDNDTHSLWQCNGTGEAPDSLVCNYPKSLSIDGVCGFANLTCDAGIIVDLPDNSTHYLWSCTGINGGLTDNCNLSINVKICGNGELNAGEHCDNGDSSGQGQCPATYTCDMKNVSEGDVDDDACVCDPNEPPAAVPNCDDSVNLFLDGKWSIYCCGVPDWVCPEDFQAGPNAWQVECTISDPDCNDIEDCTNGFDDDGDGDVDCNDSSCCGDPACKETLPLAKGGSENEGAYNYACCNNGQNEDADYYTDALANQVPKTDKLDDQCVVFNGKFNSHNEVGDQATFPVNFTDLSSGAPALNDVKWHFTMDSFSSGCGSAPAFSPSLPQIINFVFGDVRWITDMILSTSPASSCQVLLIAETMANTPQNKSIPGVYTLYGSSYASTTTPAKVLEIPAIIYPTNIYSSNAADAQSVLDSASVTVSSLQAACAASCPSGAQKKLSEALVHLDAAEYFMGGCRADGDKACQLSQYYSSRAKQLATEGLAA